LNAWHNSTERVDQEKERRVTGTVEEDKVKNNDRKNKFLTILHKANKNKTLKKTILFFQYENYT